MTHGTLETWNQFYARRRLESQLTAKQASAEWRALRHDILSDHARRYKSSVEMAENTTETAQLVTRPYNKPYVPNMIKLSW